MKLLTIFVICCASTVWGHRHLAEIKTLDSTPRNDFENSVHSEETYHSGSYVDNTGMADTVSTSASLPEEKPMPTTGCFGHLPEDHNNDISKVPENSNGLPPQMLSDPTPPEFNKPHHRSFSPHHQYYQHYPNYPFSPYQNPWSPWRRQMGFNGPQSYFQQNQMYNNNPWQQWGRPMPYMGSQFNPQQNQFYPNNPWSPWRRHSMPYVGPQMSPQFFPQNHNGAHPMVIVKLLQPIILPVAKPYFPEGGARDPDTEVVESQRYTNRGQHGFHKFNHHNRFAMERMRNFEQPMPVRRAIPNEYGPFKLNGAGENIQISVKLH